MKKDKIELIGWEDRPHSEWPMWLAIAVLFVTFVALTINSCAKHPAHNVKPTPTPAKYQPQHRAIDIKQ